VGPGRCWHCSADHDTGSCPSRATYHDWIPLKVSPVVEEPLTPLPVIPLTDDVRVEHRAGWCTEAIVYHFDFLAQVVRPGETL
jgi:hypothetical protein